MPNFQPRNLIASSLSLLLIFQPWPVFATRQLPRIISSPVAETPLIPAISPNLNGARNLVLDGAGTVNTLALPNLEAAPAVNILPASIKEPADLVEHSKNLTFPQSAQTAPKGLDGPARSEIGHEPAPATPAGQDEVPLPTGLTQSPDFPGPTLPEKLGNHAGDRGFLFQSPRGEDPPIAGPLSLRNSELIPVTDAPEQNLDRVHAELASPPTEQPVVSSYRTWIPAAVFLAAISSTQFIIESMGLAIQQFTRTFSGSFLSMAGVAMAATTTLMLGSLLGGPLVDRLSILKVYRVSLGVHLAIALLLYQLDSGGLLGLNSLALFFAFNYFLFGVSRIAEAITPQALESSPLRATLLSTLQLVAIQIMGVLGPLTAYKLLIKTYGLSSVLLVYPIFLGLSLALALLLRLPPSKVRANETPRFRWSQIAAAFQILKATPILRLASAGYVLGSIFVYTMYFMTAPVYGLFAAGTAGGGEVTAWLLSLFPTGGLTALGISALINVLAQRRIKQLPDSERTAEEKRILLRHSSIWLIAAALVGLGTWLLTLSQPIFGIYPAYIFILPFGLTSTAVYLYLENVVKNEVSGPMRGTVMGLVRGGAQFLTVLSLGALGCLFEYFSFQQDGAKIPTRQGFMALSIFFMAIAMPIYLYVARGLAGQARQKKTFT